MYSFIIAERKYLGVTKEMQLKINRIGLFILVFLILCFYPQVFILDKVTFMVYKSCMKILRENWKNNM